MWLEIIIAYVILHHFVFFLLSRLLVPFLGFKKTPLPSHIPKAIMDDINKIKKKTRNKLEYTDEAFLFLSRRYKSLWFHTLLRLDIVFMKNLSKIYKLEGFLPCNSHNHLLRIFLVKSGYYEDKQIEMRYTWLNFGIHQYIRVHEDGKYFDLDLWGHTVGVPIGMHASFFIPASLLTDISELVSHWRHKK